MGASDVKYPWPSTVNVSNFLTVKPCLEEDERSSTFNIWKEQMLCLLESQGMLGFVDGKIPPPEKADATVPAAEEKITSSNVETEQMLMWRRSDRLVKGWILGSIGKDTLDAVWKLETARDVWLELDKIFKRKAANISAPTFKHQSLGNADAPPAEAGGATLAVADGAASITKTAGGDYSRYVPLYKAALRGDWQTAKDFYEKDREGAASSINSFSETALQVAIVTGKANDFVKKLVDLMTDDELARKDSLGNTSLHFAARVGNIEAAETLIKKNSDLLYIVNNANQLPIVLAAVFGHEQTLVYLKSMSKKNVENSPFEGQLGITLLAEVISSEFFDIALDLVEEYPDLARLIETACFRCALSVLASMNSVFPSGQHFCWWQKLIYSRIPLKRPN